jgi:hypothetical protein
MPGAVDVAAHPEKRRMREIRLLPHKHI